MEFLPAPTSSPPSSPPRVGTTREDHQGHRQNSSPIQRSAWKTPSTSWACNATTDWQQPYRSWVTGQASDQEASCTAHRHSMQPVAAGTPRIEFLFVAVEEVPLEPVWRAFFRGHDDKFSLYVHASNHSGHFFPADSLFHGREIPSKFVNRFRISFAEAVRRLFTYALLDATTPNAWFTVVCDSTLFIRPFLFVDHYIVNSKLSFVEAFATNDWRRRGGFRDQQHGLADDKIRKGEPWITVHRRHAGLIVGDNTIYPKFKQLWVADGIHSEHYLPTMFNESDSAGIANRSLMLVDWRDMEGSGGHPLGFNASSFSPARLQFVQSLRVNTHGFYAASVLPGFHNQASCVYNGVARSPYFLFARKFSHAPPDVHAFRLLLSSLLLAPAALCRLLLQLEGSAFSTFRPCVEPRVPF